MPKDIIAQPPVENRKKLLDAVEAARATKQAANEVWCVIGINDAHVMTIWSQPKDPSHQAIYPTGHAEDRLVSEFQGVFDQAAKSQMKNSRNHIEIFLKYSPCNFGAGSCFDNLRRFLLGYNRIYQIQIVYDSIYGGFRKEHESTSSDAMEEFAQISNCYETETSQYNFARTW